MGNFKKWENRFYFFCHLAAGIAGLTCLIGTYRALSRLSNLRYNCYVYTNGNGNYVPTKIKSIGNYGYKIQWQKLDFNNQIEVHDEYILKADFEKDYRQSDCLEIL